MLRIRNSGIDEILALDKKMIIYGASKNIAHLLTQFNYTDVANRICFIVDGDEKKDGMIFSIAGRSYPVVSLKYFVYEHDIAKTYQMIIANVDYKAAICQLDVISELDDLLSYIWWMPFLSWHSGRYSKYIEHLPNPRRNCDIPMVINYCWFGGGRLPNDVRENINSWRRSNPEFEIKEWNEDNYDVNATKYTREAYALKKYSFVADYARYDIIFRNGGFYFDTDVELFKKIGKFCQYRGFFSHEYYDLINSGSGFAAEAGDSLIGELRDRYEEREFIRTDGSYNMTACSYYETEYFMGKGLVKHNRLSLIEDFLILPYDFFSPLNQDTAVLEMTKNTCGVHKFDCSWFSDDKQRAWKKRKKDTEWVNQRIIKGWVE